MIAAGIDVAEERKGLDLVALDCDRVIQLSRGKLSVDQASEAIRDLEPTVVCIDSPSGWSTSGRSRKAERDLARLGISSFATPADPGRHPFYEWMRVGQRLYRELADVLPLYRGASLVGHAAEVFPNASAALFAGELRPANLTKNAFRRHVLRSRDVDEKALPNIDRVDAALAALTGIEALEGREAWVGDPDEGVILLPVSAGSVGHEVRLARA